MADKFYGAAANGQLAQDVTIGSATASLAVELRIDTTVSKQRALEALEAITHAVVQNYAQTGAG